MNESGVKGTVKIVHSLILLVASRSHAELYTIFNDAATAIGQFLICTQLRPAGPYIDDHAEIIIHVFHWPMMSVMGRTAPM